MTRLNAGNIVLRPWTITDAAELAVIADNSNIAGNLRDAFPYPYTIQDAVNWLSKIIPGNLPVRFFAIEYELRLAGSIGIVLKEDIYRKSAEIGYFIREDLWGRGIATLAIKTLTEYAFETFDVVRVYAEPFSDNKGSRRALENAGYTHEATLRQNIYKNGIIKDSCIYSILRNELANVIY